MLRICGPPTSKLANRLANGDIRLFTEMREVQQIIYLALLVCWVQQKKMTAQ
jgi:hypothetical protein